MLIQKLTIKAQNGMVLYLKDLFCRKQINNRTYFQNVIIYVHHNPVHHNICDHPIQYPWSSYLSCTSDRSTKLKRKEVMELFNDIENFKQSHQEKCNLDLTRF